VAWRYLRDPERRSFRWLIVGGVLLGLALAAAVAAALIEGRMFSSGGFLRLRSTIIAENIRLAAVIVAAVGGMFLYFGMLRALSFSVFTSISIFGVTAGTFLPIVTLSVMSGFETDLKTKIRGAKADVVISVADDRPFDDWNEVRKKIAGVPGILASTPYVEGEVMIRTGPAAAGIILRGIDPPSAPAVLDLQRALRDGKIDDLLHPERIGDLPTGSFNPFDDLDREAARKEAEREAKNEKKAPREILPAIILGEELYAHTLRVFIGSDVEVACPMCRMGPTGPRPGLGRFRVAGHFYSGMYEYDSKLAYTSLTEAQKFLAMPGEVTGIDVRARTPDDAREVAASVQAVLGPRYDVLSWEQLNKGLFAALRLEKIAMFVVVAFVALVASFSIISTLIMSATQKSREVAILKAMGASDGAIRRIYFGQGLYIGLLGLLVGGTAGVGVCLLMVRYGLRLPTDIYYISKLPVVMKTGEIVAIGRAGGGAVLPGHRVSGGGGLPDAARGRAEVRMRVVLTRQEPIGTVANPMDVSAPPGSAAAQPRPGASRGGAHLVVRGVKKTFLHGGRQLHVLRGIDLELRPGERVAVVGASGVGKSTLLHILGTLDAPTAGRIVFDELDVTTLMASKKQGKQLADFRNREIGFVFQFHHLLPEFTALENAMMPGLIARLPRQECAERAERILVRVGLRERSPTAPASCRAASSSGWPWPGRLLLGPRLLLGDEPTGNLDTKTGRAMHELFFELNQESGMTLLARHPQRRAGRQTVAQAPHDRRRDPGGSVRVAPAPGGPCPGRARCPAGARTGGPQPSPRPPRPSAAEESREVRRVHFRGNRKVEDDALRVNLRTVPGAVVTQDMIRDDVRTIWRMGFFEDVQVEVTPMVGGGVIVIFVLKEKPSVRKIYVSGHDEVGLTKINEVLDIKKEQILDPAKIKKNVEKIRELYVQRGFYMAEVNYELERENQNEVDVYFRVHENAKVEVRRVNFVGNKGASDDEPAGGDDDPAGGPALLRHLLGHLPRGHVPAGHADGAGLLLRPRLHQREGQRPPARALARQALALHHHLRSTRGKQYRVGELDVRGELLDDRDFYLQRLGVKPGETFNRSKVQQDMQDLTEYYKDKGYAYVNATPQTDRRREEPPRQPEPSTSSGAAWSASSASTCAATARPGTRSSAGRCGWWRARPTTSPSWTTPRSTSPPWASSSGSISPPSAAPPTIRWRSTSRWPSARPAPSRSAPVSPRWSRSSPRPRSPRTTSSAGASSSPCRPSSPGCASSSCCSSRIPTSSTPTGPSASSSSTSSATTGTSPAAPSAAA
jgi:lipoprotein-releasing system permease protein